MARNAAVTQENGTDPSGIHQGDTLTIVDTGDGGGYAVDETDVSEVPGDQDADIDEVISSGDIMAVQEFLAASMDNERKSLRKLLKLQSRLMPALLAAREEYLADRARTARLFDVATSGLVSE
jgi:hypothetical protein